MNASVEECRECPEGAFAPESSALPCYTPFYHARVHANTNAYKLTFTKKKQVFTPWTRPWVASPMPQANGSAIQGNACNVPMALPVLGARLQNGNTFSLKP